MRLLYIFLLSLISISLHAANSMEASSALAELDGEDFAYDGETSKWEQLLQQAGKQSFKKADPNVEYECVFPDAPEYSAPGWVCDEPVEGYEIAAVGMGGDGVYEDQIEKVSVERGDYINRVDAPTKAYIDALVHGQSAINVTVDTKVREYTDEDDVKIKEDQVTKQMTFLSSLSEKTQLKHMIRQYFEFNEQGEKIASILAAVVKLSYNSAGCRTLIKTYVESNLDDEVGMVDSTASRGQCDFSQIVEDMGESGWDLLRMVKSPGGEYYVLVGYNGSIIDEFESSMENDRMLWEQFKAQQGDDLEEELIKEFGTE